MDAKFPEIKEKVVNKGGDVKSYILILLKGESVYPEELSKPAKDGDELFIILLMDGG